MLLKVFAVDVLACPKCDSLMQFIAWKTLPRVTKAILSVRRSHSPAAVARLKTSENPERIQPVIIAGRVSFAFSLV